MKKYLLIFCALMLITLGASAQSSWTAPELPTSTLESGGKYYLYNTEAEMYMGQVNFQWGTEAGFTDTGLLVTLDSSNSAYTIKTDKGYVFFNGTYLYIDGAQNAADPFTFTAASNGTYTIQTASNGYLGYDAESTTAKENEIITTLASTATGIYWELVDGDLDFELYDARVILYNTLVHAESYGMTADSNEAYKSAGEVYISSTATADEVMAAVAALEIAMEGYATDDDPDEVTYAFITNPDFSSYSNSTFTGWTNSGMTYQGTNVFTNGDIILSVYPEKWVASSSSLDNAKISQTLADLPVGTYRLEADAIAVKQTTDSPEVTGVYLYASSPTTSMTSVSTTDGLPAHYAVSFEVAAEGTSVEIGFEVSGTNANWVAVDNFRLYYLSSAATELTDTESDYKKGDEATFYGHKFNVLSDNMVENHSFELGFTGWTGANDFKTEITSSNFELRSGDAQNGDVYLVGTVNGGSNAASSLGTAWSIESGKTYYFSYWIKNLTNASDTQYLKTSLTNTPGTETIEFSEPESVSADWQKVEYLFTNTNYEYVQVKFRWLNNQWGFDNFQLYQVEPAEDVLDDSEYKTGDEVTVDGTIYAVVSDNMFVNGGFNADMYGWTAAGYYVAADPDNFNIKEEGGFNEGAYLIASSGGTGNVKTPSQAIAVEEGKTYLFIGYTSGTTPKEDSSDKNLQYSALFKMKDAVTEESSDKIIVQMLWGAGSQQKSDTWTQTMAVFTAETEYVGMRMGWSGGSYDGFQLYEVEAVPEDIEWEMTEAGWGTLILPFAADVPEGLTLYAGSALSIDDSTITVGEEATSIAANTPYLVSGDAKTYEFSGTPVEAESLTSGMLTGTLVDMTQDDFTADGSEYVLQNHTEGENPEGVAFYPITSSSTGVSLDAYHCYLTLDSGSSPDGVRAFISLPGSDDETTAIEAVESEVIADGAIYDLSGRRVAKAVKGVYIQNGKKVLVK